MAWRRDEAVLLEAAVNGGTERSRNPHVPLGPDEITKDALECLEAGAQIVHQHDELGGEGRMGGAPPEQMAAASLAAYRPILERFPDALLYPTTNSGPDIETRWRHHELLAARGVLRMAFVDPGSVNLGGLDAEGLPGARGLVYANSFRDVRYKLEACARLGLGPSMAIFEPGFLRVALAYERAGRMPRGALVKLYFGGAIPFGLPPTRESLGAYLAMLEGSRLPWAVALIAGDVVESGLARMALEAGGHLRVGLEDHSGRRRPRNVELVAEAVALCAAVGRPLATRAQAAALLDLPRPHGP